MQDIGAVMAPLATFVGSAECAIERSVSIITAYVGTRRCLGKLATQSPFMLYSQNV